MCYDLTTVLTTIAAASASIVAILGGFIASKLIAISSERSAASERLKQIDEELSLRTTERDKLQAINDEDDALDFIRDHAEELYDAKSVEVVYEKSDHPVISLETLTPYWNRALELSGGFFDEFSSTCTLNDDHIPVQLLQTVKDDEFGYQIYLKCGEKLGKILREAERSNNPFGFAMPDIDIPTIRPVMSGYNYQKNNDSITGHNTAIAMLKLHKKQCEEQIHALKKPRGMVLGLVIFAMFTLCCIIAPLIASPFTTENHTAFVVAKSVFLGLFGIGLTSIFGYLVYLLKWEKDS